MTFLEFLVACLIAGIVFSPIGCTMYEDRLIANMIKDGVDPIVAKCAVNALSGSCVPVLRDHRLVPGA